MGKGKRRMTRRYNRTVQPVATCPFCKAFNRVLKDRQGYCQHVIKVQLRETEHGPRYCWTWRD